MKNYVFFEMLILLALGVVFGCNSPRQSEVDALKKEVADLKEQLGPPPSSLDQFYPPKAGQPVYLIRMTELGNIASSIMVDLMENDSDNVRSGLARFKAVYQELSGMVPEWTTWYPMEPITEFENAYDSGDPSRMMPAIDGIGNVCHSCHVAYMSKVKFRYHWDDFKEFQIPDPFGEKDISVSQLMHYLGDGLAGITSDLQQGQNAAAIKQFQAFNISFQVTKGLCGLCHETERFYFVDQKVQDMIDQLGLAVAQTEPDMAVIGQLSQGIGMESCFKCHLVHIPSALTKDAWRMQVGGAEH